MVVLNWTKSRMALMLIGSTAAFPNYFMIGSGSGAVSATQTELLHPWDKQAVTTTDGSTAFKVKWQGDWNSIEMSGNQLRELGMVLSGVGLTGSMWSRIALGNAITFDGTTELRIEETWEVF